MMIERKDIWISDGTVNDMNKAEYVIPLARLRCELQELMKDLKDMEEEYAKDYCPVEVDDMLDVFRKRFGLFLEEK